MGFDHRNQHSSTGAATNTGRDATAHAPGKRSLTEDLPMIHAQDSAAAAPVQRRAEGGPGAAAPADESAQVHAAAARGTASAATQLPHLSQIQQLFGRHDVSGVKAHTGADAAASVQQMGARAYATGDHVVLGEQADLHTVAHEAAHVVQQRGGVQLKGGVGQVGDAYEKHADEVADRVVRGASAEPLLDRFAPAGNGTSQPGGVQMAGHAGVILYGTGKTGGRAAGKGTVFKRVEKTEHTQYTNVMAQQDAGDAGAQGTFPTVYGVYAALPTAEQLTGQYDAAKLLAFAPSKDDKNTFYVEMASVKENRDDKIKDFKIGTSTTNAAELRRNDHVSSAAAAASKVKRENISDTLTETNQLGLRDSDKLRGARGLGVFIGKKFNTKAKFLTANTLSSIKKQVQTRPYPPDANVFTDLTTIETHIAGSNTVYLASSLIMNWNDNHTNDSIRLIDLAHPINVGEDGFDEAKVGMLHGIQNLRRILQGQATSTERPAVPESGGASDGTGHAPPPAPNAHEPTNPDHEIALGDS